MYFPKHWTKHTGENSLDGMPVSAWGWGETEDEAESVARKRLARAIEVAAKDETNWSDYEYGAGTMPLREMVLQTIAADNEGVPTAVVTRNRYGSLVLSTSDLMFIDIDFPEPGFFAMFFGSIFSSKRAAAERRATKKIQAVMKLLSENIQETYLVYHLPAFELLA